MLSLPFDRRFHVDMLFLMISQFIVRKAWIETTLRDVSHWMTTYSELARA